MVSLAFQNGWKGGEFNVVLFNIARDGAVWAFAVGLLGIGLALLVDTNHEEEI